MLHKIQWLGDICITTYGEYDAIMNDTEMLPLFTCGFHTQEAINVELWCFFIISFNEFLDEESCFQW